MDKSRTLHRLLGAARDAVDLGKRTGTPVWVWRDDQWVNLLAEPTGAYRKIEADTPKETAVVRESPADEESRPPGTESGNLDPGDPGARGASWRG